MPVSSSPSACGPTGHDRASRRRDEILHAAITLFASDGYADADLQVLADRLQVGKGTLYRYFPSKRELFLAAVDRGMQQLHQRIEAAIDGIADPFARIRLAIRAYLAFFAEQRELVELLIQERAQFRDRQKPTYFVHREAHIHRWRTLYLELMAERRIRTMPVERILDVVGSLLYGRMFTNYFTGRSESPEKQADDILDIVFGGILDTEERRRQGYG